jgi:hypothetical protein
MIDNVFLGVAWGFGLATCFSIFVLLLAILRGSTVYENYGGLTTWRVIALYFATGLVGGVVFGLLRPLTNRYAGKLFTAYLLLFLVYGGGTAVLLPLMNKGDSTPTPLGELLIVWAIICLPLAPAYVWVVRSWDK